MTFKTSWSDERVEELKGLWAKGSSASVIGRAMRLTRNAVLGKVHRLKLEKRSNRNDFYFGPARETIQRVAPKTRPKRIHRSSVIRVPERKPSFHAPNPDARPGLIAVMSPLTGAFLNVKRRLPHQVEMTKNELRAMLTQALINTAALS